MRLAPNIESIEKFWRSANYLAAAMLYLRGNPLLRNPAEHCHFKENIVGHWGSSPGVNAIYAHANDLIRRTGRPIDLTVGTGHAGSAILANLYLEGSLERYNPKYSRTESGMTQLFSDYGVKNGWDNEISPEYPGMMYMGGELGGSLAFSQGRILNSPADMSVCLLGDGELETALTQGSWQGFRFLIPGRDGRILPVINSNGFRMGSSSLFAHMSQSEKIRFFKGHNIQAIFAGMDHHNIAGAFDTAYEMLETQSDQAVQPIIILETQKGWTAPEKFGDLRFAGTHNSHKPILKQPLTNQAQMAMIIEWLRSYKPDELFDWNGSPFSEVLDCLPSSTHLIGEAHRKQEIQIPIPYKEYAIPAQKLVKTPTIRGVEDALIETIEHDREFIIFSPDEAESNQMGAVLAKGNVRDTRSSSRTEGNYTPGQVIEVLNEQLCHAWAHGYGSRGRRSTVISYEAFAPIFDSMSAQFIKSLDRSRNVTWRPDVASLNIILTSLGWRNTGTHHNPGYVDGLLGRELESINIYTPTSPEIARAQLLTMIESMNVLNVMVLSKHELARLQRINSEFSNDSDVGDKMIWRTLTGVFQSHASLIAIGDCMAEECLAAQEILLEQAPGLHVKVSTIEEPSILDRRGQPIINATKGELSTVWAYIGYPRTIESLLWKSGLNQAHTKVLGYKDKSKSPPGLDRYVENATSRYHIALSAIEPLHRQGQGDFSDVINFCHSSISRFNL